jgi:hypothetical protein
MFLLADFRKNNTCGVKMVTRSYPRKQLDLMVEKLLQKRERA